jgi:NTP pyrophosphatase (non-canonical NTP hydrolase)
MKLSEYPSLALQTCVFRGRQFDLEHATIGMITEAGEFADAVKRHTVYGKELDVVNLIEEVGDNLWYANLLAHLEGYDLAKDCRSKVTEGGVELVTMFDLLVGLSGAAVACAACVEMGETLGSIQDLPAMFQRYMGTLQLICDRWVFTMEDAADRNIAKLAKRYPDKVFTPERALNRDLDAERAVLEAGAVSVVDLSAVGDSGLGEVLPGDPLSDFTIKVYADGHVSGFAPAAEAGAA